MSQVAVLTRTESKLFLRDRTTLFFVFVLPIGLLSIFSLISTGDGSDPAQHIPASFLPTMAIGIGVGILGTGGLSMVLATYRERGILRRLSTTPVKPHKLLTAQLVVHLAAAVVVVALILGVGTAAFGAKLPHNAAGFALAVLLYCCATFSMGLLLSAVLPNSKAVTIVGNIIFFPLMFFAGVWTPGDLMPESIRFLRDITPMGAGMTAMQDAWAGGWPSGVNVAALIALSIVCLGLAVRYFRWE